MRNKHDCGRDRHNYWLAWAGYILAVLLGLLMPVSVRAETSVEPAARPPSATLSVAATVASGYLARTGYRVDHPSFQTTATAVFPWGKGNSWWASLATVNGAGFGGDEVDLVAGASMMTSQRSWFELLVSYDKLEPLTLKVWRGDLLEVAVKHTWQVSPHWTAGVGYEELVPVEILHATALPFVFADYTTTWDANWQFHFGSKVGYDDGGYGANHGWISISRIDVGTALSRRGDLTAKLFADIFVPVSASVRDRSTYGVVGFTINKTFEF